MAGTGAGNLDGVGTVVVKLGSSIVAEPGGRVRLGVLESVCSDISALIASGDQAVVVSSGAISCGAGVLGLSQRPRVIDELQAVSAVGQATLQAHWEKALGSAGLKAAQILLTPRDIEDRDSHVSVAATLRRLLGWGVVPVINENDTTTTEEITFGDNDLLAAQVSILLGARLLVLLTEAEGLHRSDPRLDPAAPLVEEVRDPAELDGLAIGQRAGDMGSGGMRSKVLAAEMASSAGVETVIAPGLHEQALRMAAGGDRIGTRFHPGEGGLNSFKAWLRYAKPSHGRLVLDSGAADAIAQDGRSLLPVGIKAVEGEFEAGDSVELVHEGRVIGKGLCSFASSDLEKVIGLKTEEIRGLMPGAADEAVHRDRFAPL